MPKRITGQNQGPSSPPPVAWNAASLFNKGGAQAEAPGQGHNETMTLEHVPFHSLSLQLFCFLSASYTQDKPES